MEIAIKNKSYSISYAKLVAVISLVIGVLFYTFYYYNPHAPLIVEFGLLFLFWAVIVNLAILIRLFYYWKIRSDKKPLLNLILILSANIPIAIVITYLAYIVFVNNMD